MPSDSTELSPAKSALFNFIRWTAAVVVVVGHVNSYANLIGGAGTTKPFPFYDYAAAHAHAAVMVFFVLSGYFVTFATFRKRSTREYHFSDYMLDRWSRIYSVLIVAVAFTLVLDTIGAALSPVYSDASVIPQNHFVVRLLVNLFSIQGLHGYRVQLGSNPALWSIGYEFTFYVLFGLIVFRREMFKRRVFYFAALAILLAVIGVKMTLYFFIWLLGVAAFFAARRLRLVVTWPVMALMLALLTVANHFINYLNALRLSEFGADFVFSILVALLFLPDVRGVTARWFVGANDYVAAFGYSIYAFHLPIVVFYYAVLQQGMGIRFHPIATAFVLTIACLIAARVMYHIGEGQRARFRSAGRAMCDAAVSPFRSAVAASVNVAE